MGFAGNIDIEHGRCRTIGKVPCGAVALCLFTLVLAVLARCVSGLKHHLHFKSFSVHLFRST